MSLLGIKPAAQPPAIKDDTLPLGFLKDSNLFDPSSEQPNQKIESNIADSVLLSQLMRDNGRCNISHDP
ncbi:hypothetical protein DPMN_171430 [Dreissena polymorpha]|uniref:Uncharacterized protein n=1 Tax=Dreissena polymorpha TaxID=45954 RepID=A0A9D4E1P3_DREPO|nr:hypothetical protein DPMN_171430 [Dreissena polymorpha]